MTPEQQREVAARIRAAGDQFAAALRDGFRTSYASALAKMLHDQDPDVDGWVLRPDGTIRPVEFVRDTIRATAAGPYEDGREWWEPVDG